MRKLCNILWTDVIRHVLAQVAITKCHRLMSNRNVFLMGLLAGSLRTEHQRHQIPGSAFFWAADCGHVIASSHGREQSPGKSWRRRTCEGTEVREKNRFGGN